MNKKEVILTFVGEDNFVIPKKNMSPSYSYVSGAKDEILGNENINDAATVSRQPDTDKPQNLDRPSLPVYGEADFCTKIIAFRNRAMNDGVAEDVARADEQYSKYCKSSTLPTFPDFYALPCELLNTEISKIENSINSGNLSPNLLETYNIALLKAKDASIKNCSTVGTTTSIPTTTTTTTKMVVKRVVSNIVFGSIGGIGGGGGGGGEEPKPVEVKKKGINWWIIAAIIVGGYFITKKKK